VGDDKMTTGSVGQSADEVKTVAPGAGADEVPDAAEQTEEQAVEVDGPSEALSADDDLEGVKEGKGE
jgi:hypothetical protein